MSPEKQKSAEAAGFQVGDAATFLQLSPDEVAEADSAEGALAELLANTQRLASGRRLENPLDRDGLYGRGAEKDI